jgi:hypothetical protein
MGTCRLYSRRALYCDSSCNFGLCDCEKENLRRAEGECSGGDLHGILKIYMYTAIVCNPVC